MQSLFNMTGDSPKSYYSAPACLCRIPNPCSKPRAGSLVHCCINLTFLAPINLTFQLLSKDGSFNLQRGYIFFRLVFSGSSTKACGRNPSPVSTLFKAMHRRLHSACFYAAGLGEGHILPLRWRGAGFDSRSAGRGDPTATLGARSRTLPCKKNARF